MKQVKKLAVILNTNQLGGAERSVVEQFHLFQDQIQCTFFVPDISGSPKALSEFIKQKGFQDPVSIPYPKFLYSFSRSDWYGLFLIPFLIPYLLVVLFQWNTLFKGFTSFYVNGSKASFPVFFWLTFFRKHIRMQWHFRDYPAPNFFKVINKCLSVAGLDRGIIDFHIIANSRSVEDALKKIFPLYPVDYVYNLAGELPLRSGDRPIRTIGVVSMIAPWKGIHNVLLMAGIYAEELSELGIERICFFGENIYQTNGPHKKYSDELQSLINKFNIENIEWRGVKKPESIFSEIDLLIHPSVSPEPFGRVILEAFSAGVPVISTGMGGAKELVSEGRALICHANHPKDLITKIEKIVRDHQSTSHRDKIAYQFSAELKSITKSQIAKFIRQS